MDLNQPAQSKERGSMTVPFCSMIHLFRIAHVLVTILVVVLPHAATPVTKSRTWSKNQPLSSIWTMKLTKGAFSMNSTPLFSFRDPKPISFWFCRSVDFRAWFCHSNFATRRRQVYISNGVPPIEFSPTQYSSVIAIQYERGLLQQVVSCLHAQPYRRRNAAHHKRVHW